ncbi:hypothetical protein XA68_18406 [Ophiocordyceps unilateralis]|uniref:non-specific serine/threonine protein kinase n=1 Tax=Ophiocordyceps unilateralis TaxID=268505 RepID=A0A2A9P1C2_OPHUN|nr:hypothetical protein XA68_18406 [Ophiocordyceps unilateralis]
MSGGDLSLSQALGGLRIANPDDSSNQPATSESAAAPLSSSSHTAGSVTPRLTVPVSSQTTFDWKHEVDVCPTFLPPPSLDVGRSRSSFRNQIRSDAASAASGSARSSPVKKQANEQESSPLPRLKAMPPHSESSLLQRRSSRGARASDQTRPLTTASVQNTTFAGDAPAPTTSEEWRERGAAFGVRREVDSNGRSIVRHVKKGVRDFAFGRILGEGSYSTVYLATDRQTLKEYAVKVLEKRHIIKEKKIKYVNIEKNTLNRLTEHQGIVRLYYTFQDETSLYYVLDLCNGGELLGVLKKTGTFDVPCVRFYGAQILDSINYMHSRGVVHRDLKPENVLLDDHMHVKITDFGTARLLRDPREVTNSSTPDGDLPDPDKREAQEHRRAASFVGTAEYMLAGRPPFKAASEYLTFQKIVNLDYEFPPGFPSSARDLIERCLVLEPDRRLTIEHIRNHEFFRGQQFGEALWRTKAPRLRPYIPPTPGHYAIPDEEPPTEVSLSASTPIARQIPQSSGNLLIANSETCNTKKRQRLVMITTGGRIILAPAGGEEKRLKQEISLLSPDCNWRSQRDAKGQTVWCVNADGHHYTFEETKASFNSESCHNTAEEWIACLEKSRRVAVAYSSVPQGGDQTIGEVQSALSTPSSTLASRSNYTDSNDHKERPSRNHLSKSQTATNDGSSHNKRNRFSKRQSRTGIGPVF